MEHVARYLPTIKALAEQALDMAVDASPTKPREGEFVRSLMVGVPVAHRLIGRSDGGDPQQAIDALLAAEEASLPKIVDGQGHGRLVYYYLLYDLVDSGLSHRVFSEPWDSIGIEPPASDGQVHHDAMHLMCEIGRTAALVNVAEGTIEPEPLHEQGSDDAPDTWVYREMVALHAEFNMAARQSAEAYGGAHSAALYHLHHTQPDYTTYQPWALAAFLWFPETVGFAEQQLHDVQTHLSIEGPAGALVPGLLLADAYATLRELCEKSSK